MTELRNTIIDLWRLNDEDAQLAADFLTRIVPKPVLARGIGLDKFTAEGIMNLLVSAREDVKERSTIGEDHRPMKIVSPDHFILNEAGKYEWTPARATAAWDQAYKAWRTSLKEQRTFSHEAVLLVGIPGAGKTTWLNTSEGVQVLKLGASPGTDPRHVLVFDATLTTRMSRRPLIEMAHQEGLRVEAIVFNTPLVDALERNATRSPERRVPTDTMFRMARQLEEEPPTLTEGFWRITSAFKE